METPSSQEQTVREPRRRRVLLSRLFGGRPRYGSAVSGLVFGGLIVATAPMYFLGNEPLLKDLLEALPFFCIELALILRGAGDLSYESRRTLETV
jgi:hypothetical protein